MVAFLERSTGSEGFHQVIDFLARSYICYALTKKPVVCVSFIKQFWRSAEASTDDNGEVKIFATIDGHSMTITEASLRRHLKLDYQDGITSIPNSEIFEQLTLMGFHIDSDKLTFQKGAFSPQWRFLIYNILHCLSLNKTVWEQFSSNIATAVICQEVALFPTMLDVTEPSTSPSRITSLPSHSHEPLPFPSHSPEPSTQHSPEHTTTATQPSPTQPSPRAEQHFPTPHDSPLHVVHLHGILEDDLRKTKKTYSSAFTKLILRGRKLSDAEVQEKASTETEPFIQEVTLTEVIQDQGSNEKGSAEVSTAGTKKGTASEEVPIVSTAESEPKKKSKKEIEQERLSYAEAIRLEEQMNEEQRAQIARDEEIARQWDKEERQRAMDEAKSTKKIDWNDPSVIRYHTLKMKPKTVAQARRNMIKYLKNQGNYKISDFKGMSYYEIGPIFEKVWDFNQQFEPMDMEHGSEKMKSPKKIEEKDADTQEEVKEVSKESGAKRKKSIPRK
ncbi:hypothetical protein Tco_1470398, partial [Tanacetum coccineum]